MTLTEEIKENISANSEKVNAKDFKFFNIPFLSSLARASQNHECDCQRCKNNLQEILRLSKEYPEYILGGSDKKKELENLTDGITKHLEKQHGYSKKDWFKPLYTLFGMILGVIVAFVVIFFLDSPADKNKMYFLLIVCVSMFLGYVVGSVKDSQKIKNMKIL